VPKPQITDPEDILVRVTLSSICGSDLHFIHVPNILPQGNIMGHEFVGVVEEIGPAVTYVKPGDRIVASGGVFCGKCPACRNNLSIACKHFRIYGCGPNYGDLQGVQAEYAVVKFANVTVEKIPDKLTDEDVFFVGDILSTAYMGATGMTPDGRGIKPGDVVAIFGAGPVGLCELEIANRLLGPSKIIVVDREDYRLAVATRMGADHVINAAKEDPAAAIMNITNGLGADFVIEAIGNSEVFAECCASVAFGGIVSSVGVFLQPVELPIHTLYVKNVCVQMGLANVINMKKIIGLIEAGKLDLSPLITHRMPLTEARKAYEIFDKKLDGCIKVMLKS
jgi:threonine dehydrogenase-like Zn-dependent dehydrogenase